MIPRAKLLENQPTIRMTPQSYLTPLCSLPPSCPGSTPRLPQARRPTILEFTSNISYISTLQCSRHTAYLHHVSPVCSVPVIQLRRVAHPSVVDTHLYPAALLLDPLEHIQNLVLLPHVTLDRDHLSWKGKLIRK